MTDDEIHDIDCGEVDSIPDLWIDGEFVAGWECAMTGGDPATSLLMFALIFGGLQLSVFITTSSVVIPAIISILVGSAMFALMPATLTNLALVAVLLLLGSLGLLIAFRSGT